MSSYQNDRNLKINIPKTCQILQKSLSDLNEQDWKQVQNFGIKLSMSSTFAHKFCKKSRDIFKK